MIRGAAGRQIGAALAIGALLLAGPAALAQSPADGAAPSWRFEPAPDAFSPDSLLDLRELNEKVAGETGFVRVGADGQFVRGDGAPLRLWAVNTDVGRGRFVATPLGPKTAPDLARHARFLAKRGVNMVQLHRQLSPDPSAPAGADRLKTSARNRPRDAVNSSHLLGNPLGGGGAGAAVAAPMILRTKSSLDRWDDRLTLWTCQASPQASRDRATRARRARAGSHPHPPTCRAGRQPPHARTT